MVTPAAPSLADELVPICAVCGELERERVARGLPVPALEEWPLDAEELGRELEFQRDRRREL